MSRRCHRAAKLERIADRVAYRNWLDMIVGRLTRLDLADRILRGDRAGIDFGSDVSRC